MMFLFVNKRYKVYILFMTCASLLFLLCGCDLSKYNKADCVTTEVVWMTEMITSEELVATTQEQYTHDSSTEFMEDEELISLLQVKMNNRNDSADCSICVCDFNSKRFATIGSHRMQAASLIKLYIAGAVLEEVEKGNMDKTEAVDELLLKMISESDNDAANRLTILLGNGDEFRGMQKINDYCYEHGFHDTHMGRLLLTSNRVDDNYTSVIDTTLFLKQIYLGELKGSSDILLYMKRQQHTSKLPKGIPEGIVTANKTGELVDVENDAMIALSDGAPYVITVMCQDVSLSEQGREWIVDVSSATYHYLNCE